MSELRRPARSVGICAVAAMAAGMWGCTTGSKQEELEHVAKDWSLVIRASQVIPVYPLTEDVQPGDLFLVDRPIQEQHQQYIAAGFLPLDSHVDRLQPSGFKDFYEKSFVVGEGDRAVPRYWLQPGQGKDKAWQEAPQAGFPSYSFSVKRGGGFNAALPINGVPVGLTLLGAEAADGTITIDKARTYGVDMVSLYEDVKDWANTKVGADFLTMHRSSPPGRDGKREKANYLRVISRVYLTGRMIVQLTDASSSSAGTTVGAAKPVELMTASPNADPKVASAEQYRDNVENVNSLLEGALQRTEAGPAGVLLPGASLKVVAASARSITMSEDFIDRPLVIGYLGFDLLIDENGQLGFPTATRDVLERGVEPRATEFTRPESDFIALHREIQARETKDRIATRIGELMGPDFMRGMNEKLQEGDTMFDAFGAQALEFLAPESERRAGPRHDQLTGAMRQALREANPE